MIKYTYNGTDYGSDYSVRRAIWQQEYKVFPAEPADNKAEFWQQYGVTYTQTPDVETEQQIVARLTTGVQNLLDRQAGQLNYDSCLSVCSYSNTGNAKFDAEGAAFRKWRSDVWETCYRVLAECKAGTREIPTLQELISELPELVITYPEGVDSSTEY